MAEIGQVTEVLVLGKKEAFSQLLSPDTTSEFNYTIVDDDLAIKQLIGREGYRFRAVVLDSFLNLSAFETTDELIRWVLKSCPWAVVRAIGKKSGISTVTEKNQNALVYSKVYVDAEGAGIEEWILNKLPDTFDNSLPPAPFAAGEMKFLFEAGPLLFSLCKTGKPWELEADGIVVPTYGSVDLGEIGETWTKLASPSPSLSKLMAETKSQSPITSKTPFVAKTNYHIGDKQVSRTVIFATYANGGTTPFVNDAVDGCLAAIELAGQQAGLQTLILPLLGTGGSNGLDAKEVLDGVLDAFNPLMELGDFKHVIVPVKEKERFEKLQDAAPAPIVRGQKMENDVPAGDDRLGVKIEIEALADSIALTDLDPPLVIGILGGWGTGKSFALHLLKNRLSKIRQWDLTSEEVKAKFPFVGHIYMVDFNAWTYAKENLWASLMHKILHDLNHQLGLEEAGGKHILRGFDPWSLMIGLRTHELEAFQSEIGEQEFKKLKDFVPGPDLTEALWKALKARHDEEHDLLAKDEQSLKQLEDGFQNKRSSARSAIIEHEAAVETRIAEMVADATSTAEMEVLSAKSDLEEATAKIEAQVETELVKKSRTAVWEPTRQRVIKVVGQKLLDNLSDDAQQAPASVLGLFTEMKHWQRWLKGLSPGHIVYLVAGVIGIPTLYFVVEKYTGGIEVWPFLSACFAGVGTAASSLVAASKSVRQKLEQEQATYDAELSRRRETLQAEKKDLLVQRLRKETAELSEALNRAIAKRDDEVKQAQERVRNEMAAETRRLRGELETLESNHQQDVTRLQKRIVDRKRVIGLTAGSRNLRELIRERIAAGEYDQYLGLVHRVQEDLQQISESLLPREGYNQSLFPRGKPRIVLFIDDLDRCPPQQVVEVLEAAQLLVRTELFVVVIGMDVRYVTRALEKEYKEVLERDGAPSGLDYIEKIVQIPYRLPSIDQNAMHSFLEKQIDLESEGTMVVTDDVEEGQNEADEEPEHKIVFQSSLTAKDQEQLLPKNVQKFTTDELGLLVASCNAAEVSPRAAKRLVNVFKLLKIIWFHRGTLQEPPIDTKRGIFMLLALSAKQPVIMREVLRDLDALIRRPNGTERTLNAILSERIEEQRSEENHRAVERLKEVLKSRQELLPSSVTLISLGLDNLRLVRSFSFVGETADEFDAPEMESLTDKDIEMKVTSSGTG